MSRDLESQGQSTPRPDAAPATESGTDLYIGGEQQLQGPAGDIEALLEYPRGFRDGDPIGIICHPHPLYGGTMGNKVVYMVSRAFLDLGGAVLRFNFRGVGQSQGRFDEGRGEAQDLESLAEWFRRRHPGSPLWLAGFSFGAYVAARACSLVTPQRLLLVAPPVGMFDFASLAPIEVPYMVMQGGKDEVIQADAVGQWVVAQQHRPAYHWFAEADHFFHGCLSPLRSTIVRRWGEEWG